MTSSVLRTCVALGVALIASSTSLEAQDKPIALEVGLGDVSLTKLIFLVAYDADLYKKNGLDVAQYIDPRAAATVRRSGVEVPEKFVRRADGDDIPINIGGGSPMIVGITSNLAAIDRVIVSTTDPISRYRIFASKDITDPAQLKGKRIGFTSYGSLTHLMATLFVKKMGWDPARDVSLMASGTGVQPLKTARVDASLADDIARTSLQAAGFTELLDLNKDEIPMAGSGINVSRAWLKDNREGVRRFVKSAIEATALIKTDKKVAIAALKKWYALKDEQQLERIYADVAKLPAKPYPNVVGIQRVIDTYDYHEMKKHKPQDFIDASFVEELDKSGFIDSLYKK